MNSGKLITNGVRHGGGRETEGQAVRGGRKSLESKSVWPADDMAGNEWKWAGVCRLLLC